MKTVFALLSLIGTAAVAEVNSGLEQLLTREDLRGFEPVGRVDVAEGGFCTGTLIAADLVLTAAHCVVLPDGTTVAADRVTFKAGLANGVALVEVPVQRMAVDPDYRMIDPAPMEMIERDVALLQLARPIPSAVISPFAVTSPGAGDEVSVVSYAEGRTEVLSWQRVCHVVGRDGPLIAMDCDVSFGSSGAPVLDRSGFRARIVSIVSAGSELDGEVISIGMELPAAVERLKAALRRGAPTGVAVADPVVAPGLDPQGMPGKPAKRIVLQGDPGAEGTVRRSGARFVSPDP